MQAYCEKLCSLCFPKKGSLTMPDNWRLVSEGNAIVQVPCSGALKGTEESLQDPNVLLALSVQQTIRACAQRSCRDFKHSLELSAG